MAEIQKKNKILIYNFLKAQKNAFGKSDEGIASIDFLESIWDLRQMPSSDIRFNNAHDDIVQHIIRNNDWDIDYLFLNILNLLEENEKFLHFIETVVHPENQTNESDTQNIVLTINDILKENNLKLVVTDYFENGLPIYSFVERSKVETLPLNIKLNDIPFFVEKNPLGYSNNKSSHKEPQTTPSFILVFNNAWNDYGNMTEFTLYYYPMHNTYSKIGDVKIMCNEYINTSDIIYNSFTDLEDNYCSIGQKESYYTNLKNEFPTTFESILFALKDAALFPEIQERFEKKQLFRTSLIRYDNVERLMREIKYKLYEIGLTHLYKFNYEFKPKFSENSIDINFEFDNNDELPNRVYAIIGKNGTGKTQLITSLPLNIADKIDTVFSPHIPLFSKVIAVSYSVFDNFTIPKKTAAFNYVYCGLKNDTGDQYTDKGLTLRFHNTWKKIKEIERTNKWRKILLNFIDEDIIDEFIVLSESSSSRHNMYEVSIEGYNKIKTILSSGQNILLYIISEIVANIRLDSLLLYDEPETHLHPNAISQLMNTIYELVNEFESYCIITTHSPLIIREVLSKNVFIIEREENTPSIRRISIESFGENLTTLTDEVFGNKNIQKQYKKILQELVDQGKSFEDILTLLEFDNIPLSLNARLYIKSQIAKRHEES